MQRIEIEEEKARESREAKKIAAAKKAVEHYSSDPDYKFLHDRISDLFADFLKSDIQHLNSNQLNKISLAAKWCPSLDSSFDKATLLCESVAKKVFPRDLYKEYDGVLDAHYAYRVRDRLRKEILVPLRKALELPEVYIGANKWKSIPYKRVASVAMKFYKEKFIKHDRERFQEYLEKSGKGIAAGALLPHEIIASLNGKDGGEVAKLAFPLYQFRPIYTRILSKQQSLMIEWEKGKGKRKYTGKMKKKQTQYGVDWWMERFKLVVGKAINGGNPTCYHFSFFFGKATC